MYFSVVGPNLTHASSREHPPESQSHRDPSTRLAGSMETVQG